MQQAANQAAGVPEPAISIEDAVRRLTGPGAPLAMDEVEIRGNRTRVWKIAPPSLRTVLELSREHGGLPFIVYEDERMTYAEHFRKVARLAHVLRDEYGVRKEPMGIDVANPRLVGKFEERGVDVRPEECAQVMEDARKVKTRDEIEALRMVAAISEAGFQRIKETAKPGMRESEVWAEATSELWRLGATVQGGYLTSGPNTWPKHQANTTDRILRPGDLVYADFYNIGFLGYRSCYYRTFSLGEPTAAQHEAYRTARDTLYDVLERIEPGATTDEIAAAFPDEEGEHMDWYGAEEFWEMTTNHWAHGLGLQLYEVPLVWRGVSTDHPIEIEEGMVMAVETQEPAERQGVRVEEMVVVRENGVEILSQWPVEEITRIDY